MKLIVTDQAGMRHELDAIEGWRAMEVMRDWGLPIKAECGGACACGTCHVYVAQRWLEKLVSPTEEEKDRLVEDAFEVRENSRLSCQILMSEALDGLELTLAPGTQ